MSGKLGNIILFIIKNLSGNKILCKGWNEYNFEGEKEKYIEGISSII